MSYSLLAIDDEIEIGDFVKEVAESVGFHATATTNPAEFRQHYLEYGPAVVMIDLMMPEADGIELLRQMAEDGCKAQIIVMSAADPRLLSSARRLAEAQGLRILATIEKPVTLSALSEVLSQVSESSDHLSEASLKAAIDNDELVLHFQPKVDLKAEKDWTIVGAEALVRWQHPALGMVFPDAFIPLAEETGLIGPLSRWVINEAIIQAKAWSELGFDLNVAVNFSRYLLGNTDLPNRVGARIDRMGIPPSVLTIEITESGAMANAVATMEILTRFRVKGFSLSLDDFGTGYSSLVQLHRMPFNEIKIDKSFTMESDSDPEARKIIESIAHLAQSLGVNLCAEGVETDTALALLRSIGCDTAQGYLISRPITADAFVEFLRNPSR